MGSELVAVRVYPTSVEAHMARLQLEQHGILVFLENEHLWRGPGTWDGVRLLVPEDQVTDAEALLAESAGDE